MVAENGCDMPPGCVLLAAADEARRAEVDAWLYETCTQCLQHMVDIVVQFYPAVQSLLPRILALLSNFIRCPLPRPTLQYLNDPHSIYPPASNRAAALC